MNVELGVLVSVSSAAIFALIWFIISYVNNFKQLKKIKKEFSDIQNRSATIIHKVKENELRLIQEKEKLLAEKIIEKKTRRLKQEMTGNIAHELRTPVTSIRGFLEILLSNNVAEEKKQEYLQRAFAQTQNLSELISDMSLLTKIDSKAQSLKFESVNILQIIERVYEDTSAELSEKNIAFAIDVPDDIVVSGNENLLYSIFRNLTENVMLYAGDNVQISIKMHEIKDNKVYLIFADNGKGIDDERHLTRLFERFYRIHDGRTRNTGGSGLGLSIVKNAVLFHGGTISVRKGKEGRGLEFLFSLQCAK